MHEPSTSGQEREYRDLRDSEQLYRATLSSISDAIFITDDRDLFTFVCPNCDAIFGYTPEEVLGLGAITKLLGPRLFDPAELASRREIRNIEREIVAKSGERRTLLVHVKAVAIRQGTVLYCCRDVTELRHAEEELRMVRMELTHVSRLALAGQLMASITHEIKQPLTAIVGNASAGRNLVTEGPAAPRAGELCEIFDDIIAEGRLAAEVVDRMRVLARKRPLVLQPVDINEVAADTVRFIQHDARSHEIAVVADLAPELPRVQADRVALQQVLLTLAINAIEAMDDADRAPRAMSLCTRKSAEGVEITVSDRGHGIPTEHLPRLFEPFFTTKPEGLGLGLAVARSIVDAHDGRLWAESSAAGSVFHVVLPAAVEPNRCG